MKRTLILVLVLTTFYVNSLCWSKIAQGETHTIGIKTDGKLWTSGANGAGQLELGNNLDRTTFIQVGSANNWSKIAAGNLTSLALKTDGSLWFWGLTDYKGFQEMSLDVSGLPNGIYIIQVSDGTSVSISKFIKQ